VGTEKIERDNGLAVVAKKRQPLFDRITPALNALQIPCDGPFRHGEAELLKLAVDLRRAPVGILVRQSPNQDADFLSDPRPAAARPGLPTPVQAEPGAMPLDHGLRLHDDQHILPANPGLPQDGPEQPVQSAQGWPGPSPFEDGHLLAEGEYLERDIGAAAPKDAGGSKECEDE
jgi:hypothetical protein